MIITKLNMNIKPIAAQQQQQLVNRNLLYEQSISLLKLFRFMGWPRNRAAADHSMFAINNNLRFCFVPPLFRCYIYIVLLRFYYYQLTR